MDFQNNFDAIEIGIAAYHFVEKLSMKKIQEKLQTFGLEASLGKIHNVIKKIDATILEFESKTPREKLVKSSISKTKKHRKECLLSSHLKRNLR